MQVDRGFTIAVSGKGGVGKTSLSALIIVNLAKTGSVLAIDADPDSNLPQALGVSVGKSVGEVRELIIDAPSYSRTTGAIDKPKAFELALNQVIEEADAFDIVVMGRSEGEGCYCAVNHILRQVIDTRASSYDFVVIDCEAGLEHLSRRTARDVDLMIAVTDATKNGLLTARRVQELAGQLQVDFGELITIANKVTEETKPLLEKTAQENNVDISAFVPYDPEMAEFAISGRSMGDLPSDSPSSIAIEELCRTIVTSATHLSGATNQ